jgi:hypothetical protein
MKEETLRRPFVAASQRREKNALLNKEADFCSTEQPKFTRRGCAHRFVVALAHIFYWANCVTRTKIQMKIYLREKHSRGVNSAAGILNCCGDSFRLTANKQTRRYDLSISKERKSGGTCQLIGISILPKKCVFSQRGALFTWADDRSDKIVFSVRLMARQTLMLKFAATIDFL